MKSAFLAVSFCCALFSAQAVTVNVRECGAKGDGTADDSPAIQAALDRKDRPLTVEVPDGDYRIVRTLKVPSCVSIHASGKARLFLCGETRHQRGDFLLSNADPVRGNKDISIEGGVWDGNNQGRLNKKDPDLFNTNAWSGATLNFVNVRGLKLRDMTLANSIVYNIRMCRLDGFEIRDIRFSSERIAYNQDGLHFAGEVRNGVVENIRAVSKGQTNDDMLALNADDSKVRLENHDLVCGPIENIVFRNIYAEDCHTGVRFLSIFSPIRNIRIENMNVGCRCYAVNADAARYCRTPLFKDAQKPDGVGLLENVVLDGFTLHATAKNANPLVCMETNVKSFRMLNVKRDLSQDAAPSRPFLQIRKMAACRMEAKDTEGKPFACDMKKGENRIFAQPFSSIVFSSAKEPLDYVDPLIGTEGGGSEYGGMFPGVCTPFSALQWVCMTRMGELGRTSYNFSDSKIIGFIGTRQPSIWMGDWGQVSLMPQTGKVDGDFATRGRAFSHADEESRPWLYRVSYAVDGGQMQVEMTGSDHAGIFRIQAPAKEPLHVVVDASRDYIGGATDQRPADGWIQIGADNRTVLGWNKDRMDAHHSYDLPNFKGYFALSFSRPFTACGTCVPEGAAGKGSYQKVKSVAGGREAKANRVGGYVTFVASTEPLVVRVGTSLISLEQAQKNLDAEIPAGGSFEDAVAATHAAWQKQFSRLTIETPDDDVKTIFYTGLYHALLYPHLLSEHGRYYSAFDDKIHDGESYTSYSMWDTYRAEHALLTLAAPERVDGMMTALLQNYREGGWLPKWPNPAYTGIMVGGPAEMILAEAWSKGFRGFDVNLAYEAVRKNAMQPQEEDEKRDWRDRGLFGKYPETRAGLSYYEKLGYVPCDKVHESVSRTQDFAMNDTAAAILAKATGHEADAAFFLARSKNYTNVWCREKQLFLPRKTDGSFIDKRDGSDFTETSAYTALWCVPHDPQGIARLLGGNDVYEKKLDEFFTTRFFKDDGRQNVSIHGNEPSHHVGYLYNAIGKPWKTQRQVREIMRRCYHADKRGFDGNEDCGQMSAWYILSALGFYPLNPATEWYELGSPNVEKAVLKIGKPYSETTLTILARNFSPENVYVRSVSLNGKPLQEMRIRQRDLVGGGTLEFVMAKEP